MMLIDRPLYRNLAGERVSNRNPCVRLVYLDESGMSNPSEEPIVVVAGVIVNGDQDWRILQNHLLSIQRKHLPEKVYGSFVFHAADIFADAKYFYNRKKWPIEKRMPILMDLAKIPQQFHLPVVYMGINRAATAERIGLKPEDKRATAAAYTQAFIEVVKDVDGWISANAPAEVAMLIAEDINKIKSSIRWLHAGYTDLHFEDSEVFRTKNIIDAITFAAKDESILLQLADICAFVIKRRLMKRADIEDCWQALKPVVVSPWGEPAQRTFRFVRGIVPRRETAWIHQDIKRQAR